MPVEDVKMQMEAPKPKSNVMLWVILTTFVSAIVFAYLGFYFGKQKTADFCLTSNKCGIQSLTPTPTVSASSTGTASVTATSTTTTSATATPSTTSTTAP